MAKGTKGEHSSSDVTSNAARPQKPKLTDAERHARFVEVAKKVGASEDIADFDKAFKAVVSARKRGPKPT